jgi:uncharacterized protein
MIMFIDGVGAASYGLVAVVAFAASLLGGITGYGTGLLLPPVLIPIVGAELVVPIISLSALLTNASRVTAFRTEFDRRTAILIAAAALPKCFLGAYFYNRLSGPAVTLLIGIMLVLLVPLRRVLKRVRGHLSRSQVAAAGIGYGLITGSTSGAGVLLLSILLAAGLQGAAVIATDAGISLVLGLAKVLIFQSAGSLPPSAWIMALPIGVSALPGAFLAKRLTRGLSHATHAIILDGVVVFDGLLLIMQGSQALL